MFQASKIDHSANEGMFAQDLALYHTDHNSNTWRNLANSPSYLNTSLLKGVLSRLLYVWEFYCQH